MPTTHVSPIIFTATNQPITHLGLVNFAQNLFVFADGLQT
jgi:hypothetical protein